MKALILALPLLALPVGVNAQWVRTSGPEGGYIQSFDLIGDLLFAGTDTDGLYASADAGASWMPMNNGMEFASVSRVVSKDGMLYASTRSGVYRSTDGGATWLSPSPSSPINVGDLVVTENYVFAASGGVYRSSDAGLTWELTDLFQGGFEAIGASGRTLLAGGGSDLYRSTDEGDTWDRLEEYGATVNFSIVTAADTMLVGRAGGEILRSYDAGATFQVRHLPIDFDIVNVYDFAKLGQALYVGTPYDGVYMSPDLGTTWAPASDGMGLKDVRAITAVGSKLVAGTHYSGMYSSHSSVDGGVNWQKANEGMPAGGAVLEMLTDGDTVYAGTRDGLYSTQDNGDTWTKLMGGNEYADYGWIWGIAVQDGKLFISATYDHFDTTIFRRDGQTWTAVDSGLPENLTFVFGLTSSGDNLLAGTSEGIYYSTDDGENWNPANIVPFSGVDEIYASGNGTVYATLTNEGIYRSLNDGLDWEPSLLVPNFTGLCGCGNFGYASQFNTGIWYTADNGNNWFLVGFGGSTYDVNCIGNGLVLVGTGFEGSRIYISYNSGLEYTPFSEGLIPTAIAEEFTSTDTYMFAGMDHTGVWRRPRPDGPAVAPEAGGITGASLRNYPNPFTAKTRIHFELSAPGEAKLTIYDAAGRRVGTLVDGESSEGGHDVEFNAEKLPAGVYLYRLETGGRSETGEMVKIDTRP